MGEPLSAADRSAITAEQGPVNMTIGGVVILEPSPGLEYDAICRRIRDRIHLLPRYRQRLQEPQLGARLRRPGDYLYHTWVEDENFDVEMHVRLGALPAPGGDAELAAYVGREFSRRLDRSRSPWELHIIHGYAGDKVAAVMKMHHALVDGVAAVGIGMILLDTEPVPPPVDPPTAAAAAPGVALHRYLARLATTSAKAPARILWGAADRYLMTPRSAENDLRRASEVLVKIVRARTAAPRLPLNRTISANRTYAFGSTDLAPIKAAAKASGGTVNDAVLAAVSGMLAGYLRESGVDPSRLPRDPVALVPVSIRKPRDQKGGNRISIVFVDLPVGEPDPAVRIKLIADRTNKLRGSADVVAGAFIVDTIGFVPPLMSSALASVPTLPIPGGGGKIANNLVVSNVPGPKMPLFFNGAPVVGIHPVVPLNPANQGLNVGVFSYNGSIDWGINADRYLDPPVETAAVALRASLAEIAALA